MSHLPATRSGSPAKRLKSDECRARIGRDQRGWIQRAHPPPARTQPTAATTGCGRTTATTSSTSTPESQGGRPYSTPGRQVPHLQEAHRVSAGGRVRGPHRLGPSSSSSPYAGFVRTDGGPGEDGPLHDLSQTSKRSRGVHVNRTWRIVATFRGDEHGERKPGGLAVRMRRATVVAVVLSLLSIFFVGAPAQALPGNPHGGDTLYAGQELWAWSTEGRGSEYLQS